MEGSGSNRRRQPRLRRKLPVALELRGRTFGAITSNLSATGVLLQSSQMLLAGTAVNGTLILDTLEIRFAALVRWSRSGSRSTASEPQNTMGLEFLDSPGRAYLDFLKRATGDELKQTPPTKIEVPSPRAQSRSFSSANAVLDESDLMPTAAGMSLPPFATLPAALPATTGHLTNPTGRTQVADVMAVFEKATVEYETLMTRSESPTAETRVVPRFGLFPGLTGKAEGSTRSNNQKQRGSSPLAISAAATLFERAAVAAVAGALAPGSQTVAISMDLKLVLPAQVKLGGKLEAFATLVEVSTDRVLRFQIELREGSRLVATGDHSRLLS